METPVICAEAWLALSRAMICADGEHVFDIGLGPRCPACASAVVFPLAAWLGTTTNPLGEPGAAGYVSTTTNGGAA